MTTAPASDPSGVPGSPEVSVPATLNYLVWLAAEGLNPVTAEGAIEWFCGTLPQRPLLPVLQARYAGVAGLDNKLAMFPYVEVLMEKVLIPLRQAKVALTMGHELSCVALTGMVAEMLAILRFQVSQFGRGATALNENRQERLFGKTFERLEHSRRVGALELLGLIDAATADQFKEILSTRNAYLHRLSESHEKLASKAKRSYQLTANLAASILGLGFQGTRATLSAEVLAYLHAQPQPPQNPTTPHCAKENAGSASAPASSPVKADRPSEHP